MSDQEHILFCSVPFHSIPFHFISFLPSVIGDATQHSFATVTGQRGFVAGTAVIVSTSMADGIVDPFDGCVAGDDDVDLSTESRW